ncbi:ATP-binding protein [bacterium]|nr:ATP-binding protein [bacterium]
MFVNRTRELTDLQLRYDKGNPEFFILYGRRRVGKSALLQKFCQDKPHVYFVASQIRESDNLENFRQILQQVVPHISLEGIEFRSWEAALGIIAQIAKKERFILILDEFPYLCEDNPALLSILQRWWDGVGKNTKIFLAISGSQISFMENKILAEKSPLFGRRTSQLKLQPMLPWDASLFFPDWNAKDQLAAYGILGGIPAYLERFDSKKNLEDNLIDEMFNTQGFLYEEVHFLLRMELTNLTTYMSILTAIAGGATRLTEIANKCRMASTSVSPYIRTLTELGFIQREVPFTEKKPDKSKKGIYQIADPFVAFWLRFVLPYQSLVQAGQGRVVLENFVTPILDTHLGFLFEDICRKYVLYHWAEKLNQPVLRIGRLWGKDFEFDLLAEVVDEGERCLLVGECKWWKSKVGMNILNNLKQKLHFLPEHLTGNTQLVLFASCGFTPELREQAALEKIILVSGEDILDRHQFRNDDFIEN